MATTGNTTRGIPCRAAGSQGRRRNELPHVVRASAAADGGGGPPRLLPARPQAAAFPTARQRPHHLREAGRECPRGWNSPPRGRQPATRPPRPSCSARREGSRPVATPDCTPAPAPPRPHQPVGPTPVPQVGLPLWRRAGTRSCRGRPTRPRNPPPRCSHPTAGPPGDAPRLRSVPRRRRFGPPPHHLPLKPSARGDPESEFCCVYYRQCRDVL